MDLYAYAGGDPVNYCDPDGRFKSPVYKECYEPIVLDEFKDHSLDRYSNLSVFEVGKKYLEGKRFIYVNGIWTTKEEAKQHALSISALLGGAKVTVVYNATVGAMKDIEYSALSSGAKMTAEGAGLKEVCDGFFESEGPNLRIQITTMSAGAIHVKNALKNLPKEKRDQIDVLAIAPAEIVPRRLCRISHNYASRWDPVPLSILALKATLNGIYAITSLCCLHMPESKNFEEISPSDELIRLEPHPDARGIISF